MLPGARGEAAGCLPGAQPAPPPKGCGAGRWHPWVRWVGEPRGARGGVTLGRSALSAGASEGLGKEQPEGRSRGEGEGRWARGSQPRGPAPSSAPAPFPPSSASLGRFPRLRCRQEAAPSAPPSRNSGPTCSPPLLERTQRQLRASLFPPSCCRAGKRPQHTPCPAPTPPLLPRWARAGHPRGAAGSRGTGWGSERGAAGACPARLLTPCSFFPSPQGYRGPPGTRSEEVRQEGSPRGAPSPAGSALERPPWLGGAVVKPQSRRESPCQARLSPLLPGEAEKPFPRVSLHPG